MSEEKWWPAPRYLFRKNLLLKLIKGKNIRSILEIGYGSGDMLVTYAKSIESVYGYDFSPLAKKNAETRIKINRAMNVELIENLDSMKVVGKVDCLVACEVLEHVEKDKELLQKWSEYIKPQGYMLLSVPSREKKWCANDVWAGHIRRYEKKDLIEKMSKAGLVVEKFWSYPFPFNLVLDPMLNRVAKGLTNEKESKSNIEKTKESGIVRNQNPIYRFICNPYIMNLLYPIQRIFVNTDWGSGYVVLAKKSD